MPRHVDDEFDNGVDEENHGFDEGDNVDVHNENDGPDHGVDKDTLLLSICWVFSNKWFFAMTCCNIAQSYIDKQLAAATDFDGAKSSRAASNLLLVLRRTGRGNNN